VKETRREEQADCTQRAQRAQRRMGRVGGMEGIKGCPRGGATRPPEPVSWSIMLSQASSGGFVYVGCLNTEQSKSSQCRELVDYIRGSSVPDEALSMDRFSHHCVYTSFSRRNKRLDLHRQLRSIFQDFAWIQVKT
jgi:hypothetical protein